MQMQSLYIQKSLELNLFFLRILKEHALFMQLNFTPKNKDLSMEAEKIRMRINHLFSHAIHMANGYVGRLVLASGELYTRFTEEAERQTQLFTGMPVDMALTREEYNLHSSAVPPVTMKPQTDRLNQNAFNLARELLTFKEKVYADVIACRLITNLYPLNIDHIIRENRHYVEMLQKLMMGDLDMQPMEMADHEYFWNNIMGEHAEFIEGLLDPAERQLKDLAQAFAIEFEKLAQQANAARTTLQILPDVTIKSEDATEKIKDFKTQGTKGILSCSIRSIILPLLSDHVLREANHYLRTLQDTMT